MVVLTYQEHERMAASLRSARADQEAILTEMSKKPDSTAVRMVLKSCDSMLSSIENMRELMDRLYADSFGKGRKDLYYPERAN